jgi:hypothetical protein
MYFKAYWKAININIKMLNQECKYSFVELSGIISKTFLHIHIKMCIHHDPAVPLLGRYPASMHSCLLKIYHAKHSKRMSTQHYS